MKGGKCILFYPNSFMFRASESSVDKGFISLHLLKYFTLYANFSLNFGVLFWQKTSSKNRCLGTLVFIYIFWRTVLSRSSGFIRSTLIDLIWIKKQKSCIRVIFLTFINGFQTFFSYSQDWWRSYFTSGKGRSLFLTSILQILVKTSALG